MPHLSERSKGRLYTCRHELVTLVSTVVVHRDLTVLEGARTPGRQRWLFDNGLSKTLQSEHLVTEADPLANAVDIAPYPIPDDWGSLRSDNRRDLVTEWKARVLFYELLALISYEAARLGGIEIRTGADWDRDGDYTDQTFDDLVHIEIAK